MIVAVTGATGYVGRFIVSKLIDEGMAIRAWRRPTSDLTALSPDIEWIEGDLAEPESVTPLVAGADMLVHAALEHQPGRYRGGEGRDLPRFMQLNVDGSLGLLKAARNAGVSRVVVLSSRAVFGETVAGSIGDDDPVEPDTAYGEAKAALEAFVRSAGAEGWPIAAIRPTGVYGVVQPVERSKWFALVKDALDGVEIPSRAATEVHGRDVAEATWRLLGARPSEVAGRMFNCSDIVVSHREIVQRVHAIAKMSGPVPEEGTPPRSRMRTDGLQRLGVAFGGRALLEATVAELVSAATSGQTASGAVPRRS